MNIKRLLFTPRGRAWVLAGFIGLLVVTVCIGPQLGTSDLKSGTVQSEGDAIVSAIENYRDKNGSLPRSLNDLIPEHLTDLEDVSYMHHKSYNWPYKLFNHTSSSPWAYKTSSDKTSFVLFVKDYDEIF